MKKHFCIFLLTSLLFSLSIQAQDWHESFDDAKAAAVLEQKNILLVFQGSDWCAPCIKMDHNVWSQEEFKAYARDHLVLLKADFPKRKNNRLEPAHQKHNDALAEYYNPQGIFPLVVIMNQEGKVIGETGYKKYDAQTYVKHIQQF